MSTTRRNQMLLAGGVFLSALFYTLMLLSWIKLNPLLSSLLTSRPKDTPPALVIDASSAEHTAPSSFYGIDFSSAEPVTLEITPPGKKPLRIQVRPGYPCAYEDHTACVSAYTTKAGGSIIFLTIHSGVGGEADNFRHAVEGTWINRAAFRLDQIQDRLDALQGAEVTLRQGETALTGLQMAAAARIPPDHLADYFAAPVRQAARTAAKIAPALAPYTNPRQPTIIFETCGWRTRQEEPSPAASDTTGSIYLGVIQMGQ